MQIGTESFITSSRAPLRPMIQFSISTWPFQLHTGFLQVRNQACGFYTHRPPPASHTVRRQSQISAKSPNCTLISITCFREPCADASSASPTEVTPGRSSKHALKASLLRRVCMAVARFTSEKPKGEMRSFLEISWNGIFLQFWWNIKLPCLTVPSTFTCHKYFFPNAVTHCSSDSSFI